MDDTSLPIEAVIEIRDQCLCLATQRAARLLARRFDRLFAPLGLTNGQFSMLVALSGRWAPRLGELAAFLAMEPATVTAAMRTLERKGLISLQCDPDDSRARRAVLTDSGRRLVVRAVPLWRDEHRRLTADLPDGEAESLTRLLSQLG